MENLRLWNELKTPPREAMKQIKGGRLNGMTDISPQWRYEVMTEKFGPIGFGWVPEIIDQWIEEGAEGTFCAFVKARIKIKHEGEWSDWFHGVGGSMLTAKETKGLYTSDECFKMAYTDALSVAMKMLGVGADVYRGTVSHDSKYAIPEPKTVQVITEDQAADLEALLEDVGADVKQFLTYFKIPKVSALPESKHKTAVAMLEAKRGK